MFLTPITRADPVPATPALRRIVGVPVLALAAMVVVPWMLAVGLFWALSFVGRFGVEAVDYAGTIALGR